MEYDEDARYDFQIISNNQQQIFLEALQCECLVDQGEFQFGGQAVKVVEYKDNWYYLQVSIN